MCVYFAKSITWLYISRLLVGISHAFVTTTVYTVEISSRDMRGTFSLLEAVLRCFGCLISYGLGSFLRWNQIALALSFVPVLAFVSGLFSPESPVFLLAKGDEKKALKSVTKLYGKEYNANQEMGFIKDGICQKSPKIDLWKSFKRPDVIRPFFIIVLMGVAQQFSGMTVLRSYVVKIFDKVFQEKTLEECSGVSSEAYLAAIVLGTMRLLSSLLLSKLLYHYRRRQMYFLSGNLLLIIF